MKRILWRIPVGVLIFVSFLSFMDYRHVDASTTNQAQNSCAEGQYMDLNSNTCQNLVKNYGFDSSKFQQNFSNREYTLSTCTEAALKELFDEIRDDGGQINLPACTITIRHSFPIPSNTILQGAGIGRTIFKAASGFSGNVVKTKYEQNIIIRDVSVDGGRTANSGVLVWYSNNALVERVDVYNSKNSGIVFRFAKNITIRYSKSHGHQVYHGIDSKDCHPKSSTPDNQECAASAGPVSPGSLWSTNYAVYSNQVYDNGLYGIDIHATYGEVAGNQSYDNQYGSKFPDARYVWIHNNKFSNNNKVGSWLYATLDSSVRTVGKVVYFNNIFSGNGRFPVDLDSPASDIYLISNQYQNNQPNRLSISNAGTYVCDGTQDKSIGYDGSPAPLNASASKCDLSQVAHIFGHDNSAPPSAPTSTTVPPTSTSVPPTSTRVPSTSTSVPPTSTAVPPTSTSAPPASTPIPPTNTAVPSTSTAVPPVNTVIPPTSTTVAPTSTSAPATSTPIGTTQSNAIWVPGRVEAEAYKEGGSGVGYYDLSSGNSGGQYRTDDVDIETIQDAGNGYNIGWIEAGEWLAYDIVARQSGTYRLAVRVNTWDTVERALHITIDGENVTDSLTFDGSIGHRAWTDINVSGIVMTAGVHELKVVMDTGQFNLNYIDVILQSSGGIVSTPVSTPVNTPTSIPTTPVPTQQPTARPTSANTSTPTPTQQPTARPTNSATVAPMPTQQPTVSSTSTATATPVPTVSPFETVSPIEQPTKIARPTPPINSTGMDKDNHLFIPFVQQ